MGALTVDLCGARAGDRRVQHNALMRPRHARSLASEFDRIEQVRK